LDSYDEDEEDVQRVESNDFKTKNKIIVFWQDDDGERFEEGIVRRPKQCKSSDSKVTFEVEYLFKKLQGDPDPVVYENLLGIRRVQWYSSHLALHSECIIPTDVLSQIISYLTNDLLISSLGVSKYWFKQATNVLKGRFKVKSSKKLKDLLDFFEDSFTKATLAKLDNRQT